MNKTTRFGLGLLLGALVTGITADALLAPMVPSLNVALGVLALATVAGALSRWGRVRVTGEGRWLILPALFFAAAFAWRDSGTLELLNGLALMIALSLMALRARSGQIGAAGLADYLLGVPVAGLRSLTGHFPLFFREIGWKELPRGCWSCTALGVGRGVVIAVPLLLLSAGCLPRRTRCSGRCCSGCCTGTSTGWPVSRLVSPSTPWSPPASCA